MELKACREALKSGNKPAADELLCIKEFSMEQVKAIEEKDGRIICDFILSNGAVDRDFDTVNPDGWELENFRKILLYCGCTICGSCLWLSLCWKSRGRRAYWPG